MKPEYEVIPSKAEASFSTKIIRREKRPLLSQAWHYHKEIEICYTEVSTGKRFVGNQVSNYEEGDLVLFGSNLPHGFTTELKCVQTVIQMNPDFLGSDFFEKPELRAIKLLLQKAKRGITFNQETKEQARIHIKSIMRTSGFKQMLHLLELLDTLAAAKDVKFICSEEYSMDLDTSNLERIKVVYQYILDNYRKDLKVKEMADLLNLTEAAFYKFIKRHTKKTFTQIINEFRINHASKLLISTEKTIAEICFESGFNNISFFNRKFKEYMRKTPKEFRLGFDY